MTATSKHCLNSKLLKSYYKKKSYNFIEFELSTNKCEPSYYLVILNRQTLHSIFIFNSGTATELRHAPESSIILHLIPVLTYLLYCYSKTCFFSTSRFRFESCILNLSVHLTHHVPNRRQVIVPIRNGTPFTFRSMLLSTTLSV